MNEVGLDPGIDHMLAMECFDDAKAEGAVVRKDYYFKESTIKGHWFESPNGIACTLCFVIKKFTTHGHSTCSCHSVAVVLFLLL